MVEEFLKNYVILVSEYPEKVRVEKIKIDENDLEKRHRKTHWERWKDD